MIRRYREDIGIGLERVTPSLFLALFLAAGAGSVRAQEAGKPGPPAPAAFRLDVTPEGAILVTREGAPAPAFRMQVVKPEEPGTLSGPAAALRPASIEGPAEGKLLLRFEDPAWTLGLELASAAGAEGLPPKTVLSLRPSGAFPEGFTPAVEGSFPPSAFLLSGRARPDPDRRVCFAACGPVENPAADTLFEIQSDTAFLFQGERHLSRRGFRLGLPSSGTAVSLVPDFYRKGRGLSFYAPMDRTRFRAPPAGWCSWYYYYLNVNEEEMVKNTDWLAEHLKPYGLAYVQLDDGYQLLAPDGKQAQSWTRWNDKFPHGHRWLANYIHEKGFKAGLWLTPFSQGDEALVQAHPDWFLRDEKGAVVKTFKGALTVDATNDEVLEAWFNPLFRELAGGGGWDYFKIDGQPTVVKAYRENAARFHAPMAPEAAYRRGLAAIRDTIGPDRFLLNCWGTAPEGIGYVNGARTGGDVSASFSGILPAKHATARWFYTHNICWFTDPDVVCVRPPLTLDQARLWASLVALTGQLLMASDKMYELPEDRVEILRRIYPVLSVFPMEFYPLGERQLDVIDLKVEKRFRRWDVAGLFNWERRERPFHLEPASLGLGNGPWLVYDFWNRKFLGMAQGSFSVPVPGRSCRVLSIVPAQKDRPTLVYTSRHVTMGGVDLLDLRYDPETHRMHGTSGHLVKGEPYTIGLYVPEGGRHLYAAFSGQADTNCTAHGRFWEATFTPKRDGNIDFLLGFRGMPVVSGHKSGTPSLEGEPEVTPRSVRFSWKVQGPPVAAFQVEREGGGRRTVLDTYWVDTGLEPGRAYKYTVTVVPFPGLLLPDSPSFTVEARTPPLPPPPPKPDVYLTDLEPLSASQGWGKLGHDTSVEGRPLTIGGRRFARGLGTHAASEIVYAVKPGFKRFTAWVGVDDEAAPGTVTFEVWVDGKKAFHSPVLEGGDDPVPVTVKVEGASRVRLVVTDGGDGINYDHADWADAGFVR